MTTLNIGDLVENAAVIRHDAGLLQAVKAMTAHECDRVYVTDQAGFVSSVICDYRVLKALIRGDLSTCSLKDIASPLQSRLHPAQSLSEAAVFFRSGSTTEIPVFESHQFLGVLRRKSLLATLCNSEEMAGSATPLASFDQENRSMKGSVLSGLDRQNTRKIG